VTPRSSRPGLAVTGVTDGQTTLSPRGLSPVCVARQPTTDQATSRSLVATPDTLSDPHHVAVIMDGNGRWATRRGLERTEGHDAGELAIVAAIEAALHHGTSWLTLFAFSTENWNRPQPEVSFLMEFNRRLIGRYGRPYYQRGVRFRYLGDKGPPVPPLVAEAMTRVEAQTADASRLTVTFAFNYGGRREIVQACKRLLREGADPELLDEPRFAGALQYPDTPDPDLIIRTAGEHRISNFLLWQAAYAELVFLDLAWPDFRDADFHHALQIYWARKRTFGAVPA
jgi:undecaprenyl diphosphate synthase